MKVADITRRIDDWWGWVAIPKEIRESMKISEEDPLEIFVEKGYICLRKYDPNAYDEDD